MRNKSTKKIPMRIRKFARMLERIMDDRAPDMTMLLDIEGIIKATKTAWRRAGNKDWDTDLEQYCSIFWIGCLTAMEDTLREFSKETGIRRIANRFKKRCGELTMRELAGR